MREASIRGQARPVQSVVDWLVDGARTVRQPQEVLTELCERLLVCGLPLYRVAVFVRTLHPNVMGRRFLWRQGEGVQVTEAPHGMLDSDTYRASPTAVVFATAQSVRRRIAAPDCPDDYPIVAELRAEGVTDYLMQALPFTNGEVHAVSWTTTAEGGFTDAQIAALEAVRRPLARLAEIYALRRTAATLLSTYVGSGTGERILEGRIRRGDLERIRAVILLSDLRGFTAVSDRLPGEQVIGLLNGYFDGLVPAIEAAGGEVLKFTGDGLLAIFPSRPRRGTSAAPRSPRSAPAGRSSPNSQRGAVSGTSPSYASAWPCIRAR